MPCSGMQGHAQFMMTESLRTPPYTTCAQSVLSVKAKHTWNNGLGPLAEVLKGHLARFDACVIKHAQLPFALTLMQPECAVCTDSWLGTWKMGMRIA